MPNPTIRLTSPGKIFISHASPADNYFTAWLSSKLKLLGYEVWVELDELKSGDAFWPEIEDAIRNQSIKFLAVISNSYMEKIKNPVSGVFKELSCADTDTSEFFVPIVWWDGDFCVQQRTLRCVITILDEDNTCAV